MKEDYKISDKRRTSTRAALFILAFNLIKIEGNSYYALLWECSESLEWF